MEAGIEELLLHHTIEQKLIAYARACDDEKWDTLPEIFDRGVTVDFTDDFPEIPLIKGLDALVELLSSVTQKCSFTQHLIGNISVMSKPDGGAESRVYLRTVHSGKGERAEKIWVAMAEYRDLWRQDETGLRIKARHHRLIGQIGTLADITD